MTVAAGWAAHGAVRNDWLFNDAPGVQLPDADNSGTEGVAFSGQTTGIQTDGGGLLVANTATNYFRNANITDVTTGSAYLRMDFDGWNFAGTFQSEQIAFGFRGADNTNLVLVKVIRLADAEMRLQVNDDTNGIFNVVTLPAQDYSNRLEVVIGVDLDADTYSVLYRTNQADFVTIKTGLINGVRTADQIRFQHQNDSSQAGEYFKIDRLFQGEVLADVAGASVIASTNVPISALEVRFPSESGITYTLESSGSPASVWMGEGMELTGDGNVLRAYIQPTGTPLRVYRTSQPMP